MKRVLRLWIALVAFCLFTGPTFAAALDATATISATAAGADWDYTIKLMNTGTGNIGTFWYSWIPGQGYLPTVPISFTAPTGWKAKMTDGPPPTDGYSIQYTENSAASALTPGQSLLFEFVSTDSPSTLAGLSTIHSGTPIETSTIYGGAPFSDAGLQIVVASVPEPSTLILGVVGLMSAAAVKFARKSRK